MQSDLRPAGAVPVAHSRDASAPVTRPGEPPAPLLDPSVRTVLLVRLRVGLGDLLCTVPALRALRAARPDLHVALATWPEMAGVVDRMADVVDELVAFPGAPGIPERTPDGTLPQWRAAQRARRWDLALQVYGDNAAANEVTAGVGAVRTGGFAPRGASGLDPSLHLPYPHERHEADRHLRLLEHLGLPPGASRDLGWPVRAADEDAARELGLRPGTYAVLHPGATSASRRWPVERFAAVADGLAAAGLRVAVGGVPSEAETTRAVVDACTVPVDDLTGRTSLGSYAVLLRDAAVTVANDTGTAHLSAAVGGRVVTLFLSGDPVRWRHAEHLQTVVRADVGCNPCPHLTCPIDHRCALRISSEQVLAAALRMVSGPPVQGSAGRPPARRLPTPGTPSAAR